MADLTVALEGVGVLGPGLPDWPGCAAVLSGTAPYQNARTLLPAPAVLPPAERRRAGRVIKLALAIGAEAVRHAGRDPRVLASVFTSSGGDGDNCREICTALAEPQRLISPTRFHNSVHNAPAGYWSIAHGCAEASVTLSAFDASFAAGLLEAATQVSQQSRPVLLLAYDSDYPPPLQMHRRITDSFGIALLLAPLGAGRALATLRMALGRAAADRCARPELETLRTSAPAARGLPLLERIALSRTGRVNIEYLDDHALTLEVLAA
jgi:hypothetical protein